MSPAIPPPTTTIRLNAARAGGRAPRGARTFSTGVPGKNSVAEVEDVPPATRRPPEDPVDPIEKDVLRSEESERIEVALDRDVRLRARPSPIEIDAPIEADDVSARRRASPAGFPTSRSRSGCGARRASRGARGSLGCEEGRAAGSPREKALPPRSRRAAPLERQPRSAPSDSRAPPRRASRGAGARFPGLRTSRAFVFSKLCEGPPSMA